MLKRRIITICEVFEFFLIFYTKLTLINDSEPNWDTNRNLEIGRNMKFGKTSKGLNSIMKLWYNKQEKVVSKRPRKSGLVEVFPAKMRFGRNQQKLISKNHRPGFG